MDATIEAMRGGADATVVAACYALLLGLAGKDNPDHFGIRSAIFREVNDALRGAYTFDALEEIKEAAWQLVGVK